MRQAAGRFDIDEILKLAPLEERIYSLRCVEAWSMVIPWIGFPLAALLKQVEPRPGAKYVEFATLKDPEQFPGQKPGLFGLGSLDWPYVEGLRLDEAMHPLTLLTLGMYGQVLPNQNGAPVRVVIPWKYGFKSAKSIVRIRLTDAEPKTAWNKAAPQEYGFYSNVNPTVDHPALEPGHRAPHRRVPPAPDADVQRLRRPGGLAVHGAGPQEELLSVTRPGVASALKVVVWAVALARWPGCCTAAGPTTSPPTRSSTSPASSGRPRCGCCWPAWR